MRRPPAPVRAWVTALAASAFPLAGCPPTVGDDCDLDQAREVVYAADGTPAYAGQALLLTSCGGSSYCHTQTPMAPRFGAPGDLVFDTLLVDGAVDEDEALERLFRARSAAYRHRDGVYASVVTGTMPPAGRPPVPDLREAASAYRRYDGPMDRTGTPLPFVQSTEGREILRNWLACGAPVVERTTDADLPLCTTNADCPITGVCLLDTGECQPVGDVVEVRPTALEPTWSSIFVNVIRPSCATTGCHVGASAFNMLDLSDRDMAYTALTTRDASSFCGERPYVTPGSTDVSMSVLLDKLQPTPTCGGRMPPSGLGAEVAMVVEEWVMRGAMND
ncbi:MAG: hypothetical protein OHK0013_14840 [Sandaracinaceae bacterium]